MTEADPQFSPLKKLAGRFQQTPGMKPVLDRRFWRASGWLLAANAIVAGLGLVRTPVMTWLIPKDQVGMLGVVAAWFPFVQLASLPGLDSAAYHYIARGQPWAYASAVRERLKWSMLSAAILLALALSWAARGETALAWMFAIAGLSYPLTNGLSAAAGALSAQERFSSLFWYRLLESLTDFTGFIPILLSVWWVNQMATFYLANQVATAAMLVIYSLAVAWRLGKSPEPLPAGEPVEMKRYGRHLSVIAGIGVLQSRTDTLLVSAFQSLETIADYNIAVLVFEQIRRLWGIYVSVRYPPLVRLPLHQRQRQFLQEGLLTWLGFGLACAAVAGLAHWLIPWILPASYATSLPYIDVLALTAAFSIPGGLAEMYFRTQQDEKSQYALRIVSTVIGVAAPAFLIGPLGALGAALGRLLAGCAFSLAGIAFFLHAVKSTE